MDKPFRMPGQSWVDISRLRLLLELSRLGSMQDVAVETCTSTSTVSQGIAALARDVGPCSPRPGRPTGTASTPAGHRLAEHAVTIIAAVDAARGDLDPSTEPVGAVRVAGFATAIRRSLVPVIDDLATRHPGLQVRVHEYEPAEALDLLARDDVDLALVYDYTLAPASWRSEHDVRPLWEDEWGLGVRSPSAARHSPTSPVTTGSSTRATPPTRRCCARSPSMVGFTPNVVHRIDALSLVDDLVVAGLGVALLPLARHTHPGVRVLPLDPSPLLRGHAASGWAGTSWPPLRAVLDRLRPAAAVG